MNKKMKTIRELWEGDGKPTKLNLEELSRMVAEAEKNTGDSIAVCSSCFAHTCFMGEFYCEDYKTAGVTYRTAEQLDEIGVEHPSWYQKKEKTDVQ